jgi:hypothetical protein
LSYKTACLVRAAVSRERRYLDADRRGAQTETVNRQKPAGFLRTRRERIAPADAGLPAATAP